MKVQKALQLLGYGAEDQVTGFRGRVTCISFDLYGCIQAVLTPPAGENGKQEDARWYDVSRLKVTSKKRCMPVPEFVEDKGPAAKPEKKPF